MHTIKSDQFFYFPYKIDKSILLNLDEQTPSDILTILYKKEQLLLDLNQPQSSGSWVRC